MVSRDVYLYQHWQRYPRAEDRWSSVYSQNPSEFDFCGRVFAASPKAIKMSWSGSCMAFRIDDITKIHDPFSDFSSALNLLGILIQNDIIVVRKNPNGSVESIGLLAPTLGGSRARLAHTRFDYFRSIQWTKFLQAVRGFFVENGFVEFRTPSLVPSPGTEAYLEAMQTTVKYSGQSTPLFLPTSPEFHLKRALVDGWDRIFEIKSCYRNAEMGNQHQPEFLLLEWYRAFQNLSALISDLESMLRWIEARLDLPKTEILHTTFSDLFARLGQRLEPTTQREELVKIASDLDVSFDQSDSWNDIFHRIQIARIEPILKSMGAVIVKKFPPSQSAFARQDHLGWSERFEFYWNGMEIANAFDELNDPVENSLRQQRDIEARKKHGLQMVPVDQQLLEHFSFGLPPSAGIALGLDRLFMALLGEQDIEATQAYTHFTCRH